MNRSEEEVKGLLTELENTIKNETQRNFKYRISPMYVEGNSDPIGLSLDVKDRFDDRVATFDMSFSSKNSKFNNLSVNEMDKDVIPLKKIEEFYEKHKIPYSKL